MYDWSTMIRTLRIEKREERRRKAKKNGSLGRSGAIHQLLPANLGTFWHILVHLGTQLTSEVLCSGDNMVHYILHEHFQGYLGDYDHLYDHLL